MEEVETNVSVSVQARMTRCPKCNGFIVFDIILSDDGGWTDDVRCVNCGERFFDPRRERVKWRRNLHR